MKTWATPSEDNGERRYVNAYAVEQCARSGASCLAFRLIIEAFPKMRQCDVRESFLCMGVVQWRGNMLHTYLKECRAGLSLVRPDISFAPGILHVSDWV